MSLSDIKGKLLEWNSAVNAFNDHKMDEALERFCKIADISKLHFNIAICCCNLFDYQRAELALGKAIEADRYFAIAYYQRAWINTQLGDYTKALKDYIQSYQAMRKNLYIDYGQIGLKFQLETIDIVINAGLATVLIGDVNKAKMHFKKGIQIGNSENKKICERALELGAAAPKEIAIRYAPLFLIFAPQADQITSVEDVNYLGSSKVISEQNVEKDFDSENFLFDYMSEGSSAPLSPQMTHTFSPRIGSSRPRSNTADARFYQTESNTLPKAEKSLPKPMQRNASTSGLIRINSDLMCVRLLYKSTNCAIRVPTNVSFRDLVLHIQNKLDLELTFQIKYKDNHGDTVLITDDEDLQLCMALSRGINGNADFKLNVNDY